MLENIPQHIADAYQLALAAQKNSYSPYSNFPVGAAIKFKGRDEVAVGANIENLSFGATMCAERSAIFAHMARYGKGDIEYAIVVADTKSATLPCALCLQVMSEFAPEDFPIYMGNRHALLKMLTFRQLMPYNFDTLDDKI